MVSEPQWGKFSMLFDLHAYGNRVYAKTGALACNLFPLYFNPDIDGILPSKGIKPVYRLNAG